MLVEFAEEAIMPLLSLSPLAFRAAAREIVRLGDIVYTPEQAVEFRNALEAE